MYNIVRRAGWGLVIVAAVAGLAGCIQPDTPPVPTATVPSGVSSPPGGQEIVSQPVTSWPEVERFVQSRGQTPGNLQVWYEQPRDTDRLQGFSYTSVGEMPCTGFLLTAFTNGIWQPVNGALLCAAQPGIQALASVRLFATSAGAPYTIVFGRVEDPAISAVAVIYNDGSTQNVNTFMGGFLLVKPGIFSANVITAIDALGNTVIDNISQSEAS